MEEEGSGGYGRWKGRGEHLMAVREWTVRNGGLRMNRQTSGGDGWVLCNYSVGQEEQRAL